VLIMSYHKETDFKILSQSLSIRLRTISEGKGHEVRCQQGRLFEVISKV
jgi:hypothetical protein